MDAPQYSGPTTTEQSASEGRLKVDAGGMKKRKLMKKAVKSSQEKKAGDVLSVNNAY